MVMTYAPGLTVSLRLTPQYPGELRLRRGGNESQVIFLDDPQARSGLLGDGERIDTVDLQQLRYSSMSEGRCYK
jgi:hypothetical protein